MAAIPKEGTSAINRNKLGNLCQFRTRTRCTSLCQAASKSIMLGRYAVPKALLQTLVGVAKTVFLRKQWFCLRDTRHLRHFRWFPGFQEHSPLLLWVECKSSFSPFFVKPRVFGRGQKHRFPKTPFSQPWIGEHPKIHNLVWRRRLSCLDGDLCGSASQKEPPFKMSPLGPPELLPPDVRRVRGTSGPNAYHWRRNYYVTRCPPPPSFQCNLHRVA